MKTEFLIKLLNTMSPSGYEEEAVKLLVEELKGFTDRVEVDRLGNVIGILNPDKEPKILLSGHLDEIGLQVMYIDEKGFIHFRAIGGWDPVILPGQRVVIKGRSGKLIKGVIGRKPSHLLKGEERERVPKIKDLYIDIGVSSKKEAEEIIEVGDPIVIDRGPEFLNEYRLIARGMDDRIGAFVVVEVLRELYKVKEDLKVGVYGIMSSQEEVGFRGAKVATQRINPDIGIAIDVTFATDQPDIEKKLIGDIELGKGPVIARGPNIHPQLYNKLREIAENYKIPYQLEAIPELSGTDAVVIQTGGKGVITGLVSIPDRYMHTPCEMVDTRDVEGAVRLLTEFIKSIKDLTEFKWLR